MSRPSFEAHPTSPGARAAGIGDVSVTVRHVATASIFMLSAEDARALAYCILRAVDEAEGRPVFTSQAQAVAAAVADECSACGHGRSSHRAHGGQCAAEAGTASFAPCGCPSFQQETTRRACSRCLNDCSNCTCVGDRAGKGT